MKIIVVGRANNRAVVCWRNVVPLMIILAAVLGFGTAITHWLLSDVWSVRSAMLGICLAAGIVGGGVIRGLQTPVDQLIERGKC
jgi:hypothetical protein